MMMMMMMMMMMSLSWCVCVCVPVCHTPVLYRNVSSYYLLKVSRYVIVIVGVH